ncbi:hypothetical protein L0337_30265 [candidate division KSB1 bacterium]|nr:hypothetical protein [candidate division KSB1 bacterium]
MNFKQFRRRLKPKSLWRRMTVKLFWWLVKLKRVWIRFKLRFFVALSLALSVIDYGLIYPHLYWLTTYILIVTLFIAFVQWWYRERSPAVMVPKLQFVARKNKNAQFNFTEILAHEFDYVKETASQAMNDRHTMVNYFLLSAGVVLAGLGLMLSEEGGAKFPYRFEIVVGMNLLFNAIGWVYFMQVVRLRQAWCESARAMNHLKLLFMDNCDLRPNLADKVFRWNIKSIPEAAKKMTVFYFSALLISILNAAAIALAGTILPNIDILLDTNSLRKSLFVPAKSLWIGLALGVYHLFFQMSMYTGLLEEPTRKKEKTKRRMKRLETLHHKKSAAKNEAQP